MISTVSGIMMILLFDARRYIMSSLFSSLKRMPLWKWKREFSTENVFRLSQSRNAIDVKLSRALLLSNETVSRALHV